MLHVTVYQESSENKGLVFKVVMNQENDKSEDFSQ